MGNREKLFSFAARPLGIGFLIITALGIFSSLASLIFLPGAARTTLYIITHLANMVGDMVTFAGSILLILNKNLGKIVVQVGSIIFGIAGILFLIESALGGIVTLAFALAFFILSRRAKILD